MQDGRARPERAYRGFRCALALAAAFNAACATGVDVTDEELAEICSDTRNSCGSVPGSGLGGASGAGGSSSSTAGNSSGGTSSTANGGTGTANGGSFSSTGGTSSSTGGTASTGTGGTSSVALPAEGECLNASDLTILYEARKTNASEQEPSMVLSVQNTAGTTFDLSTLTIRYWFTADGTSNFIGTVDYASLNGSGDLKSSITVTFGEESGSNYAQMGFAAGAGSVDSGGVRELQLRFHAQPYAAMNQANDFSFIASTTQVANPNITPYLNGEQVGGCIPAP